MFGFSVTARLTVAQPTESVATIRVNAIEMPPAFPSGAAGQLISADGDIGTILIEGRNSSDDSIRYYKSLRQQGQSPRYVNYSTPLEIARLSSCFGYTVALSPDGRWLAIAGGQSSSSELHIIDLLADQGCSDETRLTSLSNEGRSALTFSANSTRLWVGTPYASFSAYGNGPTQGHTTEFGLGFNGQWATTRGSEGYLFGERQAPNFNAGYAAALAFSGDTSVRAVLAEANKQVTTGYERNPASPTILLQREGASDALFSYENPILASRVGTRLSIDGDGMTVVHAANTRASGWSNDHSINLFSFSWTGGGWRRQDQNDISVSECFGQLPNIASSYDDPRVADTVISADGRRLATTIYVQGRQALFAFGLCLFSKASNGIWELLATDSQTATSALRSAIGDLFSAAPTAELGKLQANGSLERVLIPHKDFAAVIELEWTEVEVIEQPRLPIWLLYEASKS